MPKETLKRVMHLNDNKFVFALVGELGAVHFHVSKSKSEACVRELYGGIEVHDKKPRYEGHAVSEETCWLIKCPCYHDGSSLQAEECHIPIFKMCNETGDFERLWRQLEIDYQSRLDR